MRKFAVEAWMKPQPEVTVTEKRYRFGANYAKEAEISMYVRTLIAMGERAYQYAMWSYRESLKETP